MNLASLSNEQLGQNLRALQEHPESSGEVDRLQQAVQGLQVHRIELEMQNRALQETQSELEQAIQRYSDLYDHLPVAYVTVRPTGQIVSANRAALECFGAERRGLVGGFLGRFLDPYDAGRFAAHLEGCVQSSRAATIDLALRVGSRPALGVQLSSRRAPVAGEPEVHIAITDVSQLKHAQRVLEETNREQDAFNHSISHDLRAPLVTIDNYAGIVLEEHAANLDEEGRGMVVRIQAAAQRMEATLQHLLDYSQLAREAVVLTVVNAEELLRELTIEHRGPIEAAKAEIQIERPLATVTASREMLRRVFEQLLSNALKYATPGEPPRVRIFTEAAAERVILKVADQGIGIDPKHHERIFRVFERLHGYSLYPGTGVGLAIARRATERMNGRIWVESELGRGSCFCVNLPKA